MRTIDDAACAVTIPGIDHLAPVLLMRDGTYQIDPSLCRAYQLAAQSWVGSHGEAFKALNLDLLTPEPHP